tara:strand:+ start:185 stop:382 length:198 start_codon:yes stop_codon:yes gene_type:complete
MAKDSKANGVEAPAEVQPLDLDEQMKGIEAQIAELRGTHNFLAQLKQNGFKVIPPAEDAKAQASS